MQLTTTRYDIPILQGLIILVISYAVPASEDMLQVSTNISIEQIHNIYDTVASFMHVCSLHPGLREKYFKQGLHLRHYSHWQETKGPRGWMQVHSFFSGPSSILHLLLMHLLLSLETMWISLPLLLQQGNDPITAAYGAVVQDCKDTYLLIVWKMSSHFILIKFASQPISPPLYTQFMLVFLSFCITFMKYYIMRPIQIPHSDRIAII